MNSSKVIPEALVFRAGGSLAGFIVVKFRIDKLEAVAGIFEAQRISEVIVFFSVFDNDASESIPSAELFPKETRLPVRGSWVLSPRLPPPPEPIMPHKFLGRRY